MRTLRAGLMLVMAATGCRNAAQQCPPRASLEALHLVSYWLDRREPAVAADEGATLLKSNHGLEGPALQHVRAMVAAARDAQHNPNGLALAAENTRVFLRDWRCLPEELHQDFHTRLPPVAP